MDSKIVEFLERVGRPQTALEISKGVGKVTTADVNPTLFQLEREKRVQRAGLAGSKPLWELVQGSDLSASQGTSAHRRPSTGSGKPTARSKINAAGTSAASSTQSTNAAVGEITAQMQSLSMDELWKKSLDNHQQEFRTALFVKNFLPELRKLPLTDSEYSQIRDLTDNMERVDLLFDFLRTKTRKHFDQFCSILDNNGYEHLAKELRESSASQSDSLVGCPPQAGIPKRPPVTEATPTEHPPAQTAPRREETEDTDGVESEEKDVRFVLVTANQNEYDAMKSFLPSAKQDASDDSKSQKSNIANATFNDDAKLRDMIKVPEDALSGKYFFFKAFGNMSKTYHDIAVVKCISMGSSGPSGSRMETLKLLLEASEKKWHPEAIFLIGCCGSNTEKVGTVLIANGVIHYNRGKIEPHGFDWKPEFSYNSEGNDWFQHVKRLDQIGDHAKKVEPKDIGQFLSGDYVVKNEDVADYLSWLSPNPSAGFEMEGLGVAEAVEIAKSINTKMPSDTKLPLPEFVIVKGVSDPASKEKKDKFPMKYFDEELSDVEEDERQQRCTIMAAAHVLRTIVHFS